MNYEEEDMDTKECPKCGSDQVGPSFALEFEKKDNGMVVVTDPFFACAECEHAWQVKRVMVISKFPNATDFSNAIDESC